MPLPTKFVAIDTETTSLNPWTGGRVFSAAAVFPDGRSLFWRDDFSGLRELLEDDTVDKVFFNAKFDIRMLEFTGFQVAGKVWDAAIFCHLMDGRDAGKRLSLDYQSRKYLPSEYRKVTHEIHDWFRANGYESKKQLPFDKLPPDILRRRNVGDAQLTLMLFMKLFKTVEHHFGFLLEQEHRLLPIVRRMEDRGITVDYEELEKQHHSFGAILDDVLHFCEGVVGRDDFNINSRKDQELLLERAGVLHLLTERTPITPKGGGGQLKLNDWTLRQLHHPAAHMLLLGKAAAKMQGTFVGQAMRLAIDGVLHANFNQLGTTSGRFSCSGPNLQNIPIEGDRRTAYTEAEASEAFEMTWTEYAPHLKRNFLVRPGYVHIHSDKKQAEMVMLAHYTGDANMIRIFNSGESIHDGICRLLYGEWTKGLKTRTKAVVFGYQYGAGLETLARKIGSNVAEARATKLRLAQVLPTLPAWKRHLDIMLRQYGYVETDHGRRHYLKQSESYITVNRMCQGTVGDEIKSRMVAIGEWLEDEGIDGRVLLNIHDDICTELPDDPDVLRYAVPKIYEIMHETSIPYLLPLPSSMDISYTRWSDLAEIKDITKPEEWLRGDAA